MNPSWSIPQHVENEFAPKRTKYAVCVITLNEGGRIRGQLLRMKRFAESIDIIIADGDSTDGSLNPEYLKSCGVRTLLITKEIGLSTATRLALSYAMEQGYDGVVTIDGNGKDGVEALPEFLRQLDAGYDLVQGSRFMAGGVQKNTPRFRLFAIRCLAVPLLALGGFRYTDPTNAFRALSRSYLLDPRIQPFRPEFVYFSLQLFLIYEAARLKFKIIEIPVSRVYPDDGSVPTKITTLRHLWRNMSEIIQTVIGRYRPR